MISNITSVIDSNLDLTRWINKVNLYCFINICLEQKLLDFVESKITKNDNTIQIIIFIASRKYDHVFTKILEKDRNIFLTNHIN